VRKLASLECFQRPTPEEHWSSIGRVFGCLAESQNIDETIHAVEVEPIRGGVDALDVIAECRILDEHRPSPLPCVFVPIRQRGCRE
jgi:hypothetical protein